MYLIGYKLSSSRFWCLLYKTEKWGGMCRIGTDFFVYVFFCGWGRSPPRPSRARPTPSAGSPPQRPRPPSSPVCNEGGTSLLKQAVIPRALRRGTHHFYNRTCRSSKTFLVIMFASSGISHARTFTSFECSLSETPPLRKETREGLCQEMLLLSTCAARLLLSPRDVLVPSGFTNLGFLLNRLDRLSNPGTTS